MKHAIGAAGLALAITAILAPYNGLYVSGVALLIAGFAAFRGEKLFAAATPIVTAMNLFFLSPHTLAMVNKSKEVLLLWLLIVIFLAIPYIAMALNASGAFDFRQRTGHH